MGGGWIPKNEGTCKLLIFRDLDSLPRSSLDNGVSENGSVFSFFDPVTTTVI